METETLEYQQFIELLAEIVVDSMWQEAKGREPEQHVPASESSDRKQPTDMSPGLSSQLRSPDANLADGIVHER